MIFIKHKVIFKRIIIGLLVFILFLTCGFIIWAKDSYKAVSDFSQESSVECINNQYIVFKPKEVEISKGFIFYPGAKVEPEAYSALCSKVAEQGYMVVIAPMTLNLAILSPNKAKDIIEEYKDIDTWTIGGHSLGGVMAANYAVKDNNIKGVVFYASYPQGDALKGTNLKVLSLYGSNDGVADLNKVRNASLPENSEVIEIEGGNHAGFGNYGHQKGDNEAEISNDDQINKAAYYTVEFLNGL